MAIHTERPPHSAGVPVFARIARWTSDQMGRSHAFILALGTVILWAILGPFFKFSDAWQLVINTGTTIITFLAVFLMQHTQVKDTLAIQLKLDELIRTSNASNRTIGLEDMTDDELEQAKDNIRKRRLDTTS